MRFVTDQALTTSIKSAVVRAARVKLAVAFWGKHAIELVGLNAHLGRAQILCDAFSGACDPSILSELVARHDVRFTSGLHAKVYWTPDVVVVGSANASVNGLRNEQDVLRLEAGIESADPDVIAKAEAWFDDVYGRAEGLTAHLINQIRPVWEVAQANRPLGRSSETSLLQTLLEDPEQLANRRVFLMVMNEGEPSRKAKQAFKGASAKLFSQADLDRYNASGIIPYYEDIEASGRDVRGDDVFVDFLRGPRGGLRYTGLWQVRKNGWRIEFGGGSIVIVDEVDHFHGLTLNLIEARSLRRVLKELIRAKQHDYDLNDYLDMPLSDKRPHLLASAKTV